MSISTDIRRRTRVTDATRELRQALNDGDAYRTQQVADELVSALEALDGRERGIPVVFDVTGPSLVDSANDLVHLLADAELPGKRGNTSTIQSWWLPEREVKGADGNDNADMTLVRRDRLRNLVTAFDHGDGDLLEEVVNALRRQIDGAALDA